jgi:putative DNA primase/helicase
VKKTKDCLKAALGYAARGWRVFPLNGKQPFRGTHGHNDATVDPKQIRRWWKKWPRANVGLACGGNRGPIVIDIDGPSGEELLAALSLQPTREAKTRRGRHLYFDPPLDGARIQRTIKIRVDGVKHDFDVLGDGGYVIAPPSIRSDGKRYRWVKRGRVARLPKSIFRLVKTSRRDGQRKGDAPRLPDVIGEGERDQLLTSLAGSMRRRGASEEAILAALREENATRVEPPLSDKQLAKIARSIAQKPPAGRGEHYTDLGNARRFIAQHREDIRSLGVARRPWRVWDGTRWVSDESGEADRRAKATVRSLYAEAAHAGDPDERDGLLKHAARSEQAPRIHAMMTLAATEPEICATLDTFDADPWLLNVENGTVDLRKGALRSHRRDDLISKLAPVEHDPSATAPRWEKFLEEIMAGDADTIDFLRRAVGYSLTGSTREQCLFFCYGRGANGKSTFLEVLRGLLGDYAQAADFTTFLARRGEGPRNDLARMRGARLVTAIEAHGERGFDETVLKQLTGGDTIMARKLYEEFFEFTPTHKLFLAANHKPMVREQTEAFWRRIRLIPFTVTFSPESRDKKLGKKLLTELPGILNWAIAGARDWRQRGLGEPKSVRRATKAYREENDVLGEFVAQRCRFETDAWTSTPELYRAFTDWWTEMRGPRSQPISMAWFFRMLTERPEIQQAKRRGVRGWVGVAIKLGGDE